MKNTIQTELRPFGWRFEISSAWRLGEGGAVDRQIGKTLQVACPKVVPEVAPDVTPEVVREAVALNLFDIDPHTEPEGHLHIDLDLDQLEDSEE